MSRIEEALKRAREAAPGQAPVTIPEVFQDPWAVAEAESVPPGSEGGPAPHPADDHQYMPGSGTEAPDSTQESPAGQKPEAEGVARAEDAAPAEDASVPPALTLFQGFDPQVAEKIVATPDIRPAFVEQYRKLAGVLHHAQLEKNIKVVMVTSAMAGEGKTLTSTNLALTFSESYHRSVLLIDADLRRPTLHETFQVPNVSGLGDGLRADREQKLSLVQVSPRLTLLTAGRPDPDPMSGLTSDRMKRVIEEAASRFDWVIIDTPPVGLLPDARLLAAMADATLLVIRATKTPYAMVRRAIEAIGRDRIFGVVLNRAEDGVGTGSYGYYNYYDSYGAKGK
jgi:capsular exopolysaccharide synthesis family protein